MTALTYQKDARTYRFSLPNEIWGLKLPPTAFSVLAYLCYLNSHHSFAISCSCFLVGGRSSWINSTRSRVAMYRM